jgi:D-alanyl-D-alanine carboxypeptidase/D-alanyl-D-alanine-endopeptidase (penicillin-binding protein 4)
MVEPRVGSRPDRRSRWWLVVPAALLSMAASAVGVVRDQEQPAAVAQAVAGPRAVTPVLSARRVPELVVAPVAGRRLAARLDGLTAALPDPSCMVVRGPSGVIYAHNADRPVKPASNEKLNTAFALLATLDPASTFTTAVTASAPPAGGTVAGNLYLVGGGDPLLMTDDYAAHFRRQPQIQTDFEALADAVVAAGVTGVQGSVVGDETRYDALRSVPVWPRRLVDQAQAGPLSALMVNDGFASFPATQGGGQPVPAADPPAHAAGVFTALLRARGVAVAGAPTSGAAPSTAASVASVTSPPLATVVAEMLQESDNTTAELLTKELGRQAGGAPTTAAGVAVIGATLADAGLAPSGVAVADGSGLAEDDDRVTCSSLSALLAREGPDSALARALPVAGVSGTLESRFKGTAAEGRVSAKSGTLNVVSALAGYARSPGAGVLEFAIVANVDTGRLTATQLGRIDELTVALMSYPELPDTTSLGPEPPG